MNEGWRLCALLACLTSALPAAAQEGVPPRWQPAVRADALLAREPAVHAGLGVSVPTARAVRLEVTAAVGRGERPGGAWGAEGRAEALLRFSLDPSGALRWSAYGGAGAGLRVSRGETRELLLVVVGIEGPPAGRVRPFVEAGLGGGARVGGGLRLSAARTR